MNLNKAINKRIILAILVLFTFSFGYENVNATIQNNREEIPTGEVVTTTVPVASNSGAYGKSVCTYKKQSGTGVMTITRTLNTSASTFGVVSNRYTKNGSSERAIDINAGFYTSTVFCSKSIDVIDSQVFGFSINFNENPKIPQDGWNVIDAARTWVLEGEPVYTEPLKSIKCNYEKSGQTLIAESYVNPIDNGAYSGLYSIKVTYNGVSELYPEIKFPTQEIVGTENDFNTIVKLGQCPSYAHYNPATNKDGSDFHILALSNTAYVTGMKTDYIILDRFMTPAEIAAQAALLAEQNNKFNDAASKAGACIQSKSIDQCKTEIDKATAESNTMSELCNPISGSSIIKDGDTRKNICTAYSVKLEDMLSKGIVESYTDGCGMLSRELRDYLYSILNLIKYMAPIIIIVLGMLDFVRAASSSEADAMKKAYQRFTKRIIAAILLFIIPSLLEFVLKQVGDIGLDPLNTFCK